MTNSYIKNGDVIVDTNNFSIKIASDRVIYIKTSTETKYTSLDIKIKKGISSYEKQAFIEKIARKLEEKRKDNILEKNDEK